jgi:hypothetical protein
MDSANGQECAGLMAAVARATVVRRARETAPPTATRRPLPHLAGTTGTICGKAVGRVTTGLYFLRNSLHSESLKSLGIQT